ncbi:MAG: hypothetical protein ABW047_11430 [Nitrospiraceae bacterium]
MTIPLHLDVLIQGAAVLLFVALFWCSYRVLRWLEGRSVQPTDSDQMR